MPHRTIPAQRPAARPRAPYRVYRGDAFVAAAPTLEHLCQLLEALEQQDLAARQAFEVARDRRPGVFLVDRPAPPRPHVIDARGAERDDLCAPWAIRHYFNHGTKTAPRLAEWPWDGDVRPRGAPVPGTGRRARYGRCYLRYPSTQRDRRLGHAVVEDGEPLPRGARRPHAIPNAWDDLPRRDRKDRSWKRHRATQWTPRQGHPGWHRGRCFFCFEGSNV